jgi:hypothetical protein
MTCVTNVGSVRNVTIAMSILVSSAFAGERPAEHAVHVSLSSQYSIVKQPTTACRGQIGFWPVALECRVSGSLWITLERTMSPRAADRLRVGRFIGGRPSDCQHAICDFSFFSRGKNRRCKTMTCRVYNGSPRQFVTKFWRSGPIFNARPAWKLVWRRKESCKGRFGVPAPERGRD